MGWLEDIDIFCLLSEMTPFRFIVVKLICKSTMAVHPTSVGFIDLGSMKERKKL